MLEMKEKELRSLIWWKRNEKIMKIKKSKAQKAFPLWSLMHLIPSSCTRWKKRLITRKKLDLNLLMIHLSFKFTQQRALIVLSTSSQRKRFQLMLHGLSKPQLKWKLKNLQLTQLLDALFWFYAVRLRYQTSASWRCCFWHIQYDSQPLWCLRKWFDSARRWVKGFLLFRQTMRSRTSTRRLPTFWALQCRRYISPKFIIVVGSVKIIFLAHSQRRKAWLAAYFSASRRIS